MSCKDNIIIGITKEVISNKVAAFYMISIGIYINEGMKSINKVNAGYSLINYRKTFFKQLNKALILLQTVSAIILISRHSKASF